jgi:hypothetical protein
MLGFFNTWRMIPLVLMYNLGYNWANINVYIRKAMLVGGWIGMLAVYSIMIAVFVAPLNESMTRFGHDHTKEKNERKRRASLKKYLPDGGENTTMHVEVEDDGMTSFEKTMVFINVLFTMMGAAYTMGHLDSNPWIGYVLSGFVMILLFMFLVHTLNYPIQGLNGRSTTYHIKHIVMMGVALIVAGGLAATSMMYRDVNDLFFLRAEKPTVAMWACEYFASIIALIKVRNEMIARHERIDEMIYIRREVQRKRRKRRNIVIQKLFQEQFEKPVELTDTGKKLMGAFRQIKAKRVEEEDEDEDIEAI